jgi:hypothetical protein
MTGQLIPSILLLTAWLLFVLAHGFFVATYLYWELWWLDIPMHLGGGALFLLTWYHLRGLGVFISIIHRPWCGLLGAIIGWELFKYLIGSTVVEGYVLDTVIDVFCGLGGD